MPGGQVGGRGRGRLGLVVAGWVRQLSGGSIDGAWIIGAWIRCRNTGYGRTGFVTGFVETGYEKTSYGKTAWGWVRGVRTRRMGPSHRGLALAPPPGPATGIGLEGGIVKLAGIGQGPGLGRSGRRLGLFGGPKQVALQGCFGQTAACHGRKLLGGFRSHGSWGRGPDRRRACRAAWRRCAPLPTTCEGTSQRRPEGPQRHVRIRPLTDAGPGQRAGQPRR